MTFLSDETLMAYADGELDAAEAARVRALVQANDTLQERLRRLRATDDLLKASVSTQLDVPERFAALLGDGPAPTASAPAGGAQVMPLRARGWSRRHWLPMGAGIAAALLIVVAGNITTSDRMPWLEQVDDGIALAGPVLALMADTPSGQMARAGGLDVKPIVSFVSSDGRMCREAHVQDSEMASRILVCRDVADNEWCVEAFARVKPVVNRLAYQAASGIPNDPVIDAAYGRLGRQSILDREAEARAIRTGWTSR
ncbi:MAG: hypothetical protein KJS87_01790 [Alphaproteobacteria bacterium]|nr:hypothetical protein [Alphaproteobacteria bacterium]